MPVVPRSAPAGAVLAFALAWSGAFAQTPTPIQTPTEAPAPRPQSYGVWRNPKDSVHVEVRRCGLAACGVVVWANAKAQADAREGGTPELIGLELFRNFVREPDGTWRGKVFVPDLNRTFTGAARPIGARTLQARGCLFAVIVCKTQTWMRIDTPD
jgi:uncharacterized protein (DUF2147 family)